MKILVTGGLGFIGHTVVMKLEQLGHNVIVVDSRNDYGIIPPTEFAYILEQRSRRISSPIYHVDIRYESDINHIVKQFKPDIIVNLASLPRQRIVSANPQNAARVIVEGTLNLLEASVNHGVSRFVHISSSMVYGNSYLVGATEYIECKPFGQYAILKYTSERLVEDYSKQHKLESVIIRPSAVYGEYDIENRVVSKFLLTAMRDETITVYGADEVLDFTHVDDTADGIVKAALSFNSSSKIYNITRSDEVQHTLLDAANLAVSLAGKGKINVLAADPKYPKRRNLNIVRARNDLRFDPKISIFDGFKRYYNWLSESPYYNCTK